MIHNACGDLTFGDGLYDLRALLIHLRPRIRLETLEKLLRPFVSEGSLDDRYPGLEILATGIGNGDFVFPLRLSEVEQRCDLVRPHEVGIVGDNPESAGESDPAVVRCAELRGNGPLDLAHIHGPEEFEFPGMFEAAGIVGQKHIGRGTVAFSLQSVDQLGCARRQELNLDAALRLELVEDGLDKPFCAPRIDDQFVGGGCASGSPLRERQRSEDQCQDHHCA